MKYIQKKYWPRYLLVLAVFYMVIGIAAPFWRYQSVSAETVRTAEETEFYASDAGVDRAMLMETNMSAWEERIRLYAQARERLIISTFDMREGESTRDLLSVLYKKAEEGVKVQILVDGISGAVRMEGCDLFYAVSSHPNIEVKLYNRLNPLLPWKTQGRMHDKYVIADDLAYIVGGRNMFDYFIGEYPTENRSNDREILIYNTKAGEDSRDSSLYQIEDYFQKMWAREECTYFHDDGALAEKEEVKKEIEGLLIRYESLLAANPELFAEYDYETATYETNKVTLIHNPTHIYGKEPVVFYQVTELMKRAENRVVIHTPYVVCNPYMRRTLKELSNTVPNCKMLINSVENGDNFMASSDYLYRKKEIVETGIELYEYDGGLSYHGKSIVIDDDLSLIGSYNMDLRSTYVDTELMLAVNSRELTEELTGYMLEMEKDSRKVTGVHTYETPENVAVAKIPFEKKLAMRVVGFFMQPFRCLI